MKGIGILIVVFAHICYNGASAFFYLFHMPLFFFLSGAALSYSKNLTFSFWKRFKRIMVPYFGFSIICFIYWFFLESRFRPVHDVSLFPWLQGTLNYKLQQLVNIPLAFSFNDAFQYNVVLWFLPCLFLAILLYIGLKKILGKYVFIGAVASAGLGFLLQEIHLPWCLEIALVTVPFVWVGHDLYRWLRNCSWTNALLIGAIALAISIALSWYFKPRVDLRTHTYGNPILLYAVALGFITVLVLAGRLIKKDFGILEWLGTNSLAIMCLHGPLYRVLLAILSKVSGIEMDVLRGSTLLSIGATLLTIGVLVPIVLGLNRFLPWLVGKGRASHEKKNTGEPVTPVV